MSEQVAAWTGDGEQAQEDDMSAMQVSRIPPGFLPRRSEAMIAAEDRQDRAEARRMAREREDRRQVAEERALTAYRSASEERGDYVSALALAQGTVPGRSVGEVLAEALAVSEAQDARNAVVRGEVEYLSPLESVSRSAGSWPARRSDGWPGTAYEADSQIARAEQLHRDRIAFMARHNYPATETATRSRSSRRGEVSRSALPTYVSDDGILRFEHNGMPVPR